jgi:regulator of protease activity HflC (stomatin/prohibitin superfamily)
MNRLYVFTLIASISGCTCHSTGANEVGVLTRKVAPFGTKGVQPESYPPGGTYFFTAMTTDWNTFATGLQNLRMVRQKGQSSSDDDIEFKTVDGNDISIDVTVAWRVDQSKVSYLVTKVGESTRDIELRLVRPAARALVRDALNRLRSEDFYQADKRFAAAEEARTLLSGALNPEGVIVEQVLLGEHHFNPEYEEVIRQKKLAEQNAEKMKSEALAAGEESKRNLETAKGQVSQKIATAQGRLQQTRLSADAALVQADNEAQAIVAEAKANAQAIEKRNAALAGAGGKTMVKLKIAEALAGKSIVLVPTGKSGAAVQTLDVNQLVKTYAAEKALPATPATNGQ